MLNGAYKNSDFGTDNIEEAANKLRTIKMVIDLVNLINKKLYNRNILKTVIDCAMKISGCARGAILIPKNNELVFKLGLNKHNTIITEKEFNISYSICNEVFESRKSIFIEKAQNGSAHSITDSIISLNLQTIFCSPMIHENEALGVLYVDSTYFKGEYVSTVLEFFEIFASHAAVALTNAVKIKQKRGY